MKLDRSDKLLILMCATAAGLFLSLCRRLVHRTFRPEAVPMHCIYDPVHNFLQPFSESLQKREILKSAMLVVDSALIDLSIFVAGAFWIFYGRTKTLMPCLMCFYALRAVILNICKWPLPRVYLFAYPGVPSYFVDYDKTNDLFFSGHIGGMTVILTDCLLNRRWFFGASAACILLYTIFVLEAEGGHYTNDIIIGAIVGFIVTRIYFHYRHEVGIFYFRCFANILRLSNWLVSFFKPRRRMPSVGGPFAHVSYQNDPTKSVISEVTQLDFSSDKANTKVVN